MRRLWIHEIYIYICSDYLIRFPDKKNVLEAIIFLIQLESLNTFKRPFYKYKTFVDGNKIRIPYLSDLIRISPIITFSNDHIYASKSMDKYIRIFKKYKKMSDEEIFKKIEYYIKNRVHSKYIILKKYSNSNLRRIARLKIMDSNCNIIKFLLRKFIGLLAFIYFFGSIFLYIFINNNILESKYIENILPILFVLSIILGFIWWKWTWSWMKPTEYEARNNYIDD